MHKPLRIKIKDLNEHLICILCNGYFVNATRIIECLHSFCRSCIVKYVETNKYCPICEVQIHKTKPLLNLRSDQTLQDIVYKLVPGLFQNEMQRRRQFYSANPALKPQDPEQSGELIEKSHVYTTDDYISLSLEYCNDSSSDTGKQTKRYLRCPAAVSIQHLQKLIRAKYGLLTENKVDILYQSDTLSEDLTLIDVAFKYLWKRKGPLHLTYRIFETQSRKKVKLNHDYNNDNSEHPDGPSNTMLININNTTTSDDVTKNNTVDVDLNTENDQNTNNNIGMKSSDFLDKMKSLDNKSLKQDENKQINIQKTTDNNVPSLPDENIKDVNKIPQYSNNDTTAVSIANFNNNQISFSFGSGVVQNTDVEMTETKADIKGSASTKSEKIDDSNKNDNVNINTITDSKVLSEVVFSSTQINTSTPPVTLHTKTSFPESFSTNTTVEKEVQLQISESGIISVTTNSPSENNPVSPNTVFTSKSPIPNLISISTSDSIVFSTPQTSRTVPNLISVDVVSKKPDLKSIRKENVKTKDGMINSKDSTKVKDNINAISTNDQKLVVSSIPLPVYSIANNTTCVNSVTTTQSSSVLTNSNQITGSKRKVCEPETVVCKIAKTTEQSTPYNSPKPIISIPNSNVKSNIKTQPKLHQISSNLNVSKTVLKSANVSTVKSNTHSQKSVPQSAQPLPKSVNFEGETNTSGVKNIKQISVPVSKAPQSPVKKSTTVGYKTLRDPPKTWNPTLPIRTFGQISQSIASSKNQNNKIGSPEVNASTSQATKIVTQPKPAKFFKARNNIPRYLGNPASGVKPMYQISQNTSDVNSAVVSSKNDTAQNVSTSKQNVTPVVSSVKVAVNNTQISNTTKTNETKNGISKCSSNTTKTYDDTKPPLNNSKPECITTSSSVNNICKTNADLKATNKISNTNENILNSSINNVNLESNNSLESSSDKKEQNSFKSEKSINSTSAGTTLTKDTVSKINSEVSKPIQVQGSFCLKTKTSKPISSRSSPMTVSEMLQLRNSNSPKVNHIHDVKKESNLSKNVENNTVVNSNNDKSAIATDTKSESSSINKSNSTCADDSHVKNITETNIKKTECLKSEKIDSAEKTDDFKNKTDDLKNKTNLIENANTELMEQTNTKDKTNICNVGNNDITLNDDNKTKPSSVVKVDPKTLKPLTVQTKSSEISNISSSKSLNKDNKMFELNVRENTPQNELKISQTTVPIYSPIRQKYKHDLKSQKILSNINTGSLNSTKIDVKSVSSSKLDIPNSIKIPVGSVLDRSSPKSPKISSLNISNMIKPELTVTGSPHSPKFDRSSPKTFMSSPKLDRSNSKSPLNSVKYDSSKSSILGSPKSQLSPLIDRASPKNQTNQKSQQISPKSQRNMMKSEFNAKSNSNLLSTSKSSTNTQKSQKSESCLSMAQKFSFMSSNPFVSNLSSPNLSPNQFLFSNYITPAAVAAMSSYDPRLHHNLSNLAAFHNLPLNLSHLLYNQHRLSYPGAATSNLNSITNQNVSNLNNALLSGNLSSSSNQNMTSSNNVCNSISSGSSTISSRPNQISNENECKTPGVKNESEKSKKQ